MSRRALDLPLATLLAASGVPAPETEYRFHPSRKWQFDFAWPDVRLAVEFEGGVFAGDRGGGDGHGRHTRGKGFENDCEKYNEAALRGWTVLRVTRTHVRDGSALDWIEKALR